MEITPLETLSQEHHREAARIAVTALDRFETAWKTQEEAEEEVQKFIDDDDWSAFAAMDGETMLGWIGAIEHTEHGFELHPLVVDPPHHGQGIGRALVDRLIAFAREEGATMLWLGADDDFGGTSIYGKDLYPDVLGSLRDLAPTEGHPYTFYQHMGFTVVGVLPDADGPGKHDIMMAKRVAPYSAASAGTGS